MITGVVLARNEASNIVDCLETLRRCTSEILLIDMDSSDATVDLARPYVDAIMSHPQVANFDAVRNVAIPQARFDWLWFLDADERIPERTGRMVQEILQQRGDELTAITIPFKSYFCGRWIEHCGWWPGYTMARVLKKGHFRFSERLHGGVQFDGAEFRLPPDPELAIEHFSYRSIEHYVEKFNPYTSTESDFLAQQGQTLDWRAGIRAMVGDLWAYYELHQGHQDGIHGWILSWLAGQYRWFSHTKLLDRTPPDQVDVPLDLDAVLAEMQAQLALLRSQRPQLPLGIVWRSPIWDPSGYADDSRVFLKSLSCGSRPLAAEEIRWSDRSCGLQEDDVALLRALTRGTRPSFAAAITSCIPTLCQGDDRAVLNILRTTFETDRIPQDWLPAIEKFEEVWVFTSHDRVAFRRAGVPPEKIRVLPGFIDTEAFRSQGKRLPLPPPCRDRFVFLSVFDWQFRKGWDVLLSAYCRTFSADDAVALLLKITTAHGHGSELIRQQVDEVLRPHSCSLADRPDIVLWEQTLGASQMPRLYRSVDAFVLASRGEGWGRPYMEAMATGLPTIATCGSGNDDFMNESNSFLVSTRLVDVPEHAVREIPVYEGHQWLEPDVDALAAALKLVATDHKRRRSVARTAAADVRAKFSQKHAREAVEEHLRSAEQRFVWNSPPAVTDQQIRVELEGEFFAGHSFSNINEHLAAQFVQEASLAISLRRVQHNPVCDDQVHGSAALRPFFDRPLPDGPQVTVRHAFPPNWQPPDSGRWVHIQPWEFGSLPLEWMGPLRDQVDEIWAPSSYVKRVYEQSGVPSKKIHVIPWGVDPDVFRPDTPPLFLPTKRGFIFLFVGGTIARKGFDVLLEAYLEEFRKDDDVCLVVKDMGSSSFYRYGNYRDRVLETIARGDSAQIIYIDENLTPGQLASLYAAANCLVAPYRGEGFGLPILEGMACGLPAIVPHGGASDDFLDDRLAYLLPAREVECDHDWRLSGPATELSIETSDLREAMRRTLENPEQVRRRGEAAAEHVADRFTWTQTAQQMVQRIRALSEETTPPRRSASPTRSATLSACMLALGNEITIAASLARLRPYVDEMIVLDLGSEDRTAEIAAEYGARVYRSTLPDNLSLLRNASLRKATSDWILVVDADELVSEQEADRMVSLIRSVPPTVCGVEVSIRAEESSNGQHERQVRLFRNRNDVAYLFAGIDDVAPTIAGGDGSILQSDLEIQRVTDGPSGAGRLSLRCADRALHRLHEDLSARPRDATVLHHLGASHYALGNYFHAECYLQESFAQLAQQDPRAADIGSLLVESHLRKGDPERAQEVQSMLSTSGDASAKTPLLGPCEDAIRLYLGAGQKQLPGYLHVDIAQAEGIDVVCDLNRLPWPWDDGTVDVIVAEDVVEHLEIDLVMFCNEAWRVMKPHGELFIRTPHHQGDSSWIDPTHRWHLNEQAFHYLDPDTHWGQLYPQYTRHKWRILSLGVRGPQNIHALLLPRK